MLLVVNKARGVIEECCNDDWCRVVVKQMNNKETFRELLEDFECSFHTMCKVFCHLFPSREAEILKIESSTTFFPTCIDEVEEDHNSYLIDHCCTLRLGSINYKRILAPEHITITFL